MEWPGGEGHHVECQVPRRIPRVLPFVGHGDDIAIEEVRPVVIAAATASGGGPGLVGVAIQPVADHVVVELFTPQEPRIGYL